MKRLIIEIEGGVVTGVFVDGPVPVEFTYSVIDRDNAAVDEGAEEDADVLTEEARGSLIDVSDREVVASPHEPWDDTDDVEHDAEKDQGTAGEVERLEEAEGDNSRLPGD